MPFGDATYPMFGGAAGGVPVLPPAILSLDANIVHEGDSLTATFSASIPLVFSAQTSSGGRFRYPVGWSNAVAGKTLATAKTQTATVLSRAPSVVVLVCGGADIGNGSNTPAQILADLDTCISAYLAGGAQYVVVGTLTTRYAPNALSAGRETDRQTVNAGIRTRGTDRVKIADLDASPIQNAETVDGLHWNWLGALRMGNIIGSVLSTIVEPTDRLALYADAGNLCPQLPGTGGTKATGGAAISGEVADGWTVSCTDTGLTIVCSKVVKDGVAAQRIQMSGTAGAAGSMNMTRIVTASGAIGQCWEAWCGFDFAAGSSGIKVANLSVNPLYATSPIRTAGVAGLPQVSGVLRTTEVNSGGFVSVQNNPTYGMTLNFQAGAVAADVTFYKPYLRLKAGTT